MSKSSDAALGFRAGDRVVFQTAGRSGTSPERKGTVVSHRESTRGVWIVVHEDGAAEGVNVASRAAMVRLA